MESEMPHQDKDDLRTPLAELKALVRPFCDLDLGSVHRHGNAQLDQVGAVIMVLLTFGWSQKQTIGERLNEAKRASRRIFKSAALAGSHQALMIALLACGDDLFQKIRSHLVKQLSESPDWLYLGRPMFAVDGRIFAFPRIEKNLAKFAAASRKSKAAYKKTADRAKATQIAASVCLHLTTGLPMFWNLGGSADSERGMLLDMLKDLPPGSRLIMDAHYTGFQFWNQIIDHGFKFVVRAGKNVELLNNLRLEGKVKCDRDTVFYWPQTAIDAGAAPIVLKLVVVMVGRKRMFLLTNDLDLTAQQLAWLYAKRWGDRGLLSDRQADVRTGQAIVSDPGQCQAGASVDAVGGVAGVDRRG